MSLSKYIALIGAASLLSYQLGTLAVLMLLHTKPTTLFNPWLVAAALLLIVTVRWVGIAALKPSDMFWSVLVYSAGITFGAFMLRTPYPPAIPLDELYESLQIAAATLVAIGCAAVLMSLSIALLAAVSPER